MSAPRIGDHPSPNFTERRGGARADMVVLHYTGMADATSALARLCDPAAEVSAHYLIAENGAVWRLVAEEMRAWHAGAARWGDVGDVNSHSIGIELANPGHHLGYPPFPEPQMAALEALLAGILARWQIPPERVVSHACVAPGRKIDPGEKFDWRRLAKQGLAVWLDPEVESGADLPADADADADAFQRAAAALGYAVPQSCAWDAATRAVWQALSMRFLPAEATRPPSPAGIAHAARLAARWPVHTGASTGALTE